MRPRENQRDVFITSKMGLGMQANNHFNNSKAFTLFSRWLVHVPKPSLVSPIHLPRLAAPKPTLPGGQNLFKRVKTSLDSRLLPVSIPLNVGCPLDSCQLQVQQAMHVEKLRYKLELVIRTGETETEEKIIALFE